MASLNKVMLMGNLTRDIETRQTPAGLTVAKFGLAINRRYTTQQGEQREEVTFVDVDAFGKQAETLAKFCRKGSGLYVEGRLKLDQWEDKSSGEKRSKMGVVLEGFQFIGGKAEGESADRGAERSDRSPDRSADRGEAPRRTAPPAQAPGGVDPFDDVPF